MLQALCDRIDDFRFSFEKAITALDANPVEQESLYEAQAVIQDCISLVNNEEITSLLKLCRAIDSIFTAIIYKQFPFIHLLSEVLLLSYDQLNDLANNLLDPNDNFDDQQTEKVIDSLTEIANADSTTICSYAENALQVLTSQFLILDTNQKVSPLVSHDIPEKIDSIFTQSQIDQTLKSEQDLVFFRLLLNETSHRFPNIKQRSERILPLAIEMNGIADNPVNPQQLEAAIYMHDVGMSFIPEQVLTKKDNFTESDRKSMQRHPIVIAEMLRRMDIWIEAADIVQQHHEKLDGSGYPNKLTGTQICDGAKILAILDAFDAMTNIRSDRPFKKTILRAVREISTNTNQFDEHWTQIFIQVVKIHYSS